ncbi:hypothetical protein LXL04_009703 [Taraxacum kok-saghyz]
MYPYLNSRPHRRIYSCLYRNNSLSPHKLVFGSGGRRCRIQIRAYRFYAKLGFNEGDEIDFNEGDLTKGMKSISTSLLSNTAANTVLYMYCKDFHGESVLEIADGFDYINLNLTLDDEKVAHVVTVVE